MTMTTQNLLLELFVEELPPKALQTLGSAFAQVLSEELAKSGLLEKQVAAEDPRDGSQPAAKPGFWAAVASVVSSYFRKA